MRIDSRISPVHDIAEGDYSALYNRATRLQAEAIRHYARRIARAIAAAARRGMSATGSLLAAIEDARAARRTYVQLSSLSDRTLADIGISRGEIAAVAWSWPRWNEEWPRLAAVTEVPAEVVEHEHRLAA